VADPEPTATAELARNADVDWDEFDSADYFEHNYHRLLREDAEIIKIVADYFHEVGPAERARAIDVGSGTNLYPAMTMLPFISEVVLYERAHTNREWLKDQLRRPAESWNQFWRTTQASGPKYRRIADPFGTLVPNARVVEGDLFTLEPEIQYGIGTMFFVAESITTRTDEFQQAIQHFLGSLIRQAPFAMTFMRESSGYTVGRRRFPGCPVTEADVVRCLDRLADIRDVRVVDSKGLRDGYDGIIVAIGRKR
jgi:hypothetical protein